MHRLNRFGRLTRFGHLGHPAVAINSQKQTLVFGADCRLVHSLARGQLFRDIRQQKWGQPFLKLALPCTGAADLETARQHKKSWRYQCGVVMHRVLFLAVLGTVLFAVQGHAEVSTTSGESLSCQERIGVKIQVRNGSGGWDDQVLRDTAWRLLPMLCLEPESDPADSNTYETLFSSTFADFNTTDGYELDCGDAVRIRLRANFDGSWRNREVEGLAAELFPIVCNSFPESRAADTFATTEGEQLACNAELRVKMEYMSGAWRSGLVQAPATATVPLFCNGSLGGGEAGVCTDGLDNDGDGRIDMRDQNCTNPFDNSEDVPFDGPITQCTDGIDNDGDGLIDLADVGCTSPNDDDETDLPTSGLLDFVEVSVATPPFSTGPFGLAAHDWDEDGRMEVASNYHDGSDTVTRWEWNGVAFAYKDALDVPGCDLRIWAYDADLDGQKDFFCGYLNYPTARYVRKVGTDLDEGEQVTQMCGNRREDDCVPRVKMPDGSFELITRDGRLFERNGERASLLINDGISGNYIPGWYMDLNGNGTVEFVDLRPYTNNPCYGTHKNHTLVEDFDEDGDQDLFFWDVGDGQVLCAPHYLENVNGSLVERFGKFPDIMGPVPAYHHQYGITQTADLDNDGDMDLLVAGNQFNDIYKLLINDGNGNFVRATTALDGIARNTANGNNMRPQILPVDFDQDGCTDVIVSSSGTPAIRAFKNRSC